MKKKYWFILLAVLVVLFMIRLFTRPEKVDKFQCLYDLPVDYGTINSFVDNVEKCSPNVPFTIEAYRFNIDKYEEYDFI